MHYSLTALLSPHLRREEIEDALDVAMEPFLAGGEDSPNARWDWFVIGGRFTGRWERWYDAELDERNYGTCPYCTDGVITAQSALRYPAYASSIGAPCYQCTHCRAQINRERWVIWNPELKQFWHEDSWQGQWGGALNAWQSSTTSLGLPDGGVWLPSLPFPGRMRSWNNAQNFELDIRRAHRIRVEDDEESQLITHAVLLPDLTWRQKNAGNVESVWVEEWKSHIKNHQTNWAVLVDCHI